MAKLSKEEKIAKLTALINRGKNLIEHKSYQQEDWSLDPWSEKEPQIIQYTSVNTDSYPGWRMESLAILRSFLGGYSTYVKEFEENCKASSSEHDLRQGLGVLEAVRSGYQDDSILEEAPPVVGNNEAKFQIIQVNENRNSLAVEYNVSNFDVLVESIEKSDRSNKEELVTEIKKIQQELEKGNPTWETMKKWTIFALGLGKDLGINLLANIIAKSAHLS